MNKQVAVIGGGISGLTAAYRLKKAGVDVVLFEGSAAVGGNIKTENRDGFLFENGPNSTLASVELLDLLADLRITDQIAQPSSNAKKRYILKDEELVALPSGALDLLKGNFFSGKATLRLLKEPFVGTKSPDGESVSAFFERRLGKEIVDYAVDPFISGIYAGDPQKLSIRSAFARLYEMERDHGSLLKGGLFGKKDKAKKPLPKGTPRNVTFKRGMQTMTDALYADLKDNIHLNTSVDSIERDGTGAYTVRASGANESFDVVVISTPAHAAGGLIEWLDPELAVELSGIYYPPVSIVFTGFLRDQVRAECSGFGFLVPGGEKRRILGSLWTSSVFENRAPDGYHLFTTFIGGSRNSELCESSEDELVKIALDELGTILGIDGGPVFTAVKKWKKAIPQYNVGYESVPAAVASFSTNNPGMYLCSNYYKGISVSDCIKNGTSSAVEIIDYLNV